MDAKSLTKDHLNWRGNKVAALLIIGVLAQGCATVDDRKINQVGTDAEIELDINKRLFNRKNIDLFLDLQTNVYEGRVMLTGAVKSDFNRRRIETLAKGIPGIQVIYNNVQVTNSGGFKNTANDVWIKAKIRSQLLAENGIKSANYQVRVINSAVYLLGRSFSNLELNKVLTIAKRVKHVSKVIHHIVVRPLIRK